MFNSKKTFILFMLVFGLLIPSLSGCAGGGTKAAEKGAAQELVIGYGKDTNARSDEKYGPDFIVKTMVGERLVELDGEKVKPGLATSWDIQNGGKTIVFHLKKDIRFSDGAPFTAEAVKFTHERLNYFKNYSWTEVDRVKDVEIIDPHTIAFHYHEGKEGYIALTAFNEYHWTVFSLKSVEPAADAKGKFIEPLGTGPWKVADYVKDKHTVFVPNENYRGTKPKLSKITLRYIPDANARVMALRAGDVDAIVDYYHGGSDYTPRNLLQILKNEGFQVLKGELPMTTIIRFNYEKKPWDDVKVRKAVNYAVNKEEIGVLFGGWVTPAKEGLFAQNAPFAKEAQAPEYPYDLEKARQLLQEAGFANGLPAEMIINGNNPDEVKLGELIQGQLSKVGINIKLSVLEVGAYSVKQKKGDYDLKIYYVGGPERRRYTRVDGRFNPNAPEFSFGAYHAPEITPVIVKAVRDFDENKRKEAFKEFYRLMHEHAGVAPLYYDAVFMVAKPEVKGIEFMRGEPRFENMCIDK